MAINDWWRSDPGQRYWMEITNRTDLGADLIAPTADGSGRPYWGYELLTYIQAGDIVLHWRKSMAGEPGIVGWSQASGTLEDTDISWQARGTVGRTRGSLTPRPAWRMPLENYTPLAEPLPISVFRTNEDALRRVLEALEATHTGALYFPFNFSDKRALRAQQTYLVKVPREVLRVVGLDELEHISGPTRSVGGSAGKRGDSGYVADSAVRSAIEWRAVNLAIRAYEDLGYTVEYTGSREPYDLLVTREGDVRRVEVKGSSGAAATVELTSGEVSNSRASTPTDLFVADGIKWSRNENGTVQAEGGEVRWWPDWIAEDASLAATRFRYSLPPGGQLG